VCVVCAAFVTTRCQAVPEDGLELSDCSDDDENCCLPPPGPMDTMPRNPSSAQALQWGKSNDREASRGQFGWGGKEALDCPLLHHHTFVLGDLGCRTMARPQEVVHWVGASLAKDHHFAQRQQEQQQRLMTQLQALQQQQHQQQQLDDDALPPPPSANSLLGPLPAPPAPPTDDGSGDGSRDGSRDGAQHDMVLARLAAGFKGLLLPHSLSSSTGGAAQQAKPPLAPVLPQCLGLTPWKQPLMQPSSSWVRPQIDTAGSEGQGLMCWMRVCLCRRG
jgi:type II secretory pathway pseudopilin PulG